MIRQSGFYWVKIKNNIDTKRDRLTIGVYDGSDHYHWHIVNSDEGLTEEEIIVISDRLAEPIE